MNELKSLNSAYLKLCPQNPIHRKTWGQRKLLILPYWKIS